LIAALFALAACSEDVYQEIDQQNNGLETEGDAVSDDGSGGNAPFTFNPNQPGYYNGPGSFLPPDEYYSPSDIWKRSTIDVPYGIFNHASEFTMYVRAYIGLAYYDGANDGTFNDVAPGGPNFNLTLPGQYPNLYANSQEIGNLMPSVWITGQPELIFAADGPFSHCPVLNGNVGHNTLNQYFNLPTATPSERQLLASYGKVFFYEIEIVEIATGSIIPTPHRFLQVECETLGSPWYFWDPITNPPGGPSGPGGYVPSPAGYSGELSYYNDPAGPTTSSVCDSKEIVYDTQYPSSFTFSRGSDDYLVDLKMTVGHPLWPSASLHLSLYRL